MQLTDPLCPLKFLFKRADLASNALAIPSPHAV